MVGGKGSFLYSCVNHYFLILSLQTIIEINFGYLIIVFFVVVSFPCIVLISQEVIKLLLSIPRCIGVGPWKFVWDLVNFVLLYLYKIVSESEQIIMRITEPKYLKLYKIQNYKTITVLIFQFSVIEIFLIIFWYIIFVTPLEISSNNRLKPQYFAGNILSRSSDVCWKLERDSIELARETKFRRTINHV